MAEGARGSRRLASVVDDLQARGRYTFTRETVMAGQASDVAFDKSARRLKQ